MGGMNVLVVAFHLASLADKTPPDSKVTAGWGAFGIFILLCLAVAGLGWGLTKQLKRTQRNADAGMFDPSDKKPRRTTI